MDTVTQVAQPIPLFYGALSAGGITQDLDTGYDYVITAIIAVCTEISSPFTVLISDESSVPILSMEAPAAVSGGIGRDALFGDLPVGPRTALKIDCENGSGTLYIGGYALTPPSILHI